MSKAVSQSVFSLIIVLCSASVAVAAGVHEGEEVASGEWIEKRLTVRHDSNWSTEHCIMLPGKQTVEYRFSATVPLNFNFHAHPVLEDGSHRTDKFDSQSDLLAHDGKVAAELPGSYCFDFFPSQGLEEDKEIHLFYRINQNEF